MACCLLVLSVLVMQLAKWKSTVLWLIVKSRLMGRTVCHFDFVLLPAKNLHNAHRGAGDSVFPVYHYGDDVLSQHVIEHSHHDGLNAFSGHAGG